ncbi:MAG: hypothetical protein ACKN89_02625 [Cyanobium sp.]|jgi:hypothetical protein
MADDASSTQSTERRGGRGGAPRGDAARGDGGGGFRIRLSDNEMQAARSLQEAFGLRSTVAVLGFSLRTLAQMLEQGQLQELIQQQRAQSGSRGAGPGRGGEGRNGRTEAGAGGGRPKADPFARPSRPAAAPAEEEAEPPAAATADNTELDDTITAEPEPAAAASEA